MRFRGPIFGFPVHRRDHRVPGRRGRRRGRDLAFLQGLARLFAASGLRAAGDDARACRPMARCSASIPRSGGSICRSRRFQSSSPTRSSRPRTRISTSMAASTSRGMARAAVMYAQNYGSNRRPQGASTITQQVAEELPFDQRGLASPARSRKPCWRCASSAPYSKDRILELYLQRDLSRPRRLRHRRRVAGLFRQIGERTDDRRSRLSRGAAEGAGQRCIRCATATARSSGAITWSTVCWKTAGSSRPTPTRPARSRWS